MTARMLSAGLHDAEEPGDWVATLRCCSAHEAFLRTYRRAVTADLVTEFLLLDRLFPRSAIHSLGVAENCLAELQPNAGRAGLDDEALRIVGRARSDLEFRRLQDLVADLPGHLRSLQTACHEAGDAVARRFFRQAAPLEWSLRGGERPSGLAHRHHPHHRLPVPQGGDVVLQRGPHHAHLQRPPAGAGVVGGGQPVRRRLPLLGLLGHPRPRLRHPGAPHRAVGHGHVGGGDVGPPRPARRAGELARPGPARPARPLRRAAGAHHPRPRRRRRAGRGRHLPAGVVARGRLRGGGRVGEGQPPLREGHHRRVHAGARRPEPGQRRVPGLRPRHPGRAAGGRHPLPLRVRLPPPPRGGGGGHPAGRREPRLDRGVDGRLAGLRPHQRGRGRAPRGGGTGPRLLPTCHPCTASTTAVRRRRWASRWSSPACPDREPSRTVLQTGQWTTIRARP